MSTVRLHLLWMMVACLNASNILIEMYSRGFNHDGDHAFIKVNASNNLIAYLGSEHGNSGYRGYNMVLINETNGHIIDSKSYDVCKCWGNYVQEDNAMVTYLQNIPYNGQIIVITVDDDPDGGDNTFSVLKSWAGCIDDGGIGYREALIWIGKPNNTFYCDTAHDIGIYKALTISLIVPTTYIPTTLTPTTSIPTTSIPTTSIPTTSIPTTAIPTTAIPTTTIPTSVMPTTNMPSATSATSTTLIPTTSIPTTVIPTTANPTSMMSTINVLSTTTSISFTKTLHRVDQKINIEVPEIERDTTSSIQKIEDEIQDVTTTQFKDVNFAGRKTDTLNETFIIIITVSILLLLCMFTVCYYITVRKRKKENDIHTNIERIQSVSMEVMHMEHKQNIAQENKTNNVDLMDMKDRNQEKDVMTPMDTNSESIEIDELHISSNDAEGQPHTIGNLQDDECIVIYQDVRQTKDGTDIKNDEFIVGNEENENENVIITDGNIPNDSFVIDSNDKITVQ